MLQDARIGRCASTARAFPAHDADDPGESLLLAIERIAGSIEPADRLLQDDEGGLQVQSADGWIDVTPRTGTFVINIGELLELASDGYLQSII